MKIVRKQHIDRIAIAIPADEDVLAGDLDFDNNINGIDLTLLKHGFMNDFTDKKAEKPPISI